jgi:arylsulfatase A-like enzyme
MRALYDGAVRSVDAEIGRLRRLLERRGLWERTLVVITADHGEDLYEPGFLQGHGEHLRGDNVLHVPWILKLAGARPKIKRFAPTTRSIDIAATVTAAAGLPPLATSGVDLMPWVSGQRDDDPGLDAYSETGIWFSRGGDGFYQRNRLDYPGISGLLNFDQGQSGEITLNPVFEKMLVGSRHRSLISGDYKLILVPTPTGVAYELYDRRNDPENVHDLASTRPDIAAALQAKLYDRIVKTETAASLYDGYVVSE